MGSGRGLRTEARTRKEGVARGEELGVAEKTRKDLSLRGLMEPAVSRWLLGGFGYNLWMGSHRGKRTRR